MINIFIFHSNFFYLTVPNLNLFKNAIKYNSKISVISQEGKFTFSDLLKDSEKLSQTCLLKSQQNDLNQERIALICSPGYKYVVGQWSVWRSGGIFVPLCKIFSFKDPFFFFFNYINK